MKPKRAQNERKINEKSLNCEIKASTSLGYSSQIASNCEAKPKIRITNNISTDEREQKKKRKKFKKKEYTAIRKMLNM